MRILLDHCVPRRFRRLLPGHEVRTAHEMGWEALTNGELLARAAGGFDVFITVDQNVAYQQRLSSVAMTVLILVSPDNRYESLMPFGPIVEREIIAGSARLAIRLHLDGRREPLSPLAAEP